MMAREIAKNNFGDSTGMKRTIGKRKKKKFTLTSFIGLAIGTALMVIGLYYAVARDSSGACFVVFIGLFFNGLIIWIHRG